MLPAVNLVQPDGISCGPTALVVHRMLSDGVERPGRQNVVEEIAATHRALAGFRDRAGRFQLGWPRALGTSPWAAAREMTRTCGRPYTWRLLSRRRTDLAFNRLYALAKKQQHLLLYIGSFWMPRHVLLVLGTRNSNLVIFDPASGKTLELSRNDLITRRSISGWNTIWFAVVPRT